MDRHSFLLVVLNLALLYHLQHVTAETRTQDVAGSKLAFQSSEARASVASAAVDGDNSTCTITEREREPSWTVELGAVYTVSAVYINAGTDVLNYMEIHVGNNKDGRTNNLCDRFYQRKNYKDALVQCFQPVSGKYVTIRTPFSDPIKLCEVQVLECIDGYFGVGCDKECHCLSDMICSKYTGECPAGCGAGWQGPDCQESCSPGEFGPGCKFRCHCEGGQLCDSKGICPKMRCAKGWLGNTCQTQLPALTDKPLDAGRTASTFTLQWHSWNGPIDAELELYYRVQYTKYDPHKPKNQTVLWKEWPDVPHSDGGRYQFLSISNLSLNSWYEFQVTPVLRNQQEGTVPGNTSPIGGPYKTLCADPEPPDIESVIPVVDKEKEPNKATLVVKWKVGIYYDPETGAPSPEHVRCDKIQMFQILYAAENAQFWREVFARSSDSNKTINNVKPNTVYRVKVAAINNRDLIGISEEVKIRTSMADAAPQVAMTAEDHGLVAGVIIAVLLISAVFLAAYLYKKRHGKYEVPRKGADKAEQEPLNGFIKVDIMDDHTPVGDAHDSGVVEPSASETTPSSVADTLNSLDADPDKPYTKEPPKSSVRIKVEDLEDYIMDKRDSDVDGLRKEYEEIPMGFITKHDHGKQPENKYKNRFVNIIAYDHSRVILDKEEGDPDSDYINANYIDGYKKPQEYVAAQGCNKFTIQDMWRMVWQLNSGRIIMVTNLVENGKRKCEQYWPDEGEKKYGLIDVKITDTELTSDFCIRTFEITKDEETRTVKQFHFISWPDHGVPLRASPIIAFRRKVRSYDDQYGSGTMVVHCSAGVGRTGTFITIDSLLEMAKEESEVDIYGWTWNMRKDRVNMIQTVEQYIFVYDALLEALKAGNTAIPCSDFRERFDDLCQVDPAKSKSKLQEQFEKLKLMSPKVKEDDFAAGNMAENLDKNRCQEILPADRHRPYLMIRVEGTNDYINAVFLDGFKKRNQFILSQMPMPHTVIDFWRMVYEHGVTSVVMLNPMDDADESYGQYWLDDEGCEVGPFIIEPVSVDTSNPDITVRQLKLTFEPQSPSPIPNKREEKPRIVSQFQFHKWGKTDSTPSSKVGLINLIEMVERWQQKTGDGSMIVHCHNGLTASGLYTAVNCIWEKMKVDQEVDIFHAIKHLRYHRQDIVENLEQYQFCFEMVLAYLSEFETYANFR